MTGDLRASVEKAFAAEGLIPETWSNAPGYRYAEHAHPHHKVLCCVAGSIIFHTPEGDVELMPGDRLDLPAGAHHSATVGPEGVVCMEAAKS